MPHQIIVNVPPYEGEYEFDRAGSFSYTEWRWIKKIAGYMPLTIDEGWNGGDPDLMLALAVITMHRADKFETREVMDVVAVLESAEVDGASITVKLEEEEAAEVDPPQTDSPDDSKPDSGPDTVETSEDTPASTSPSGTGDPSLETTSPSDRLTLAQ